MDHREDYIERFFRDNKKQFDSLRAEPEDFDRLMDKLEIPQESPFASLNLDKPLCTLNLQKLELIAGVPKVLGNKSPELSYNR